MNLLLFESDLCGLLSDFPTADVYRPYQVSVDVLFCLSYPPYLHQRHQSSCRETEGRMFPARICHRTKSPAMLLAGCCVLPGNFPRFPLVSWLNREAIQSASSHAETVVVASTLFAIMDWSHDRHPLHLPRFSEPSCLGSVNRGTFFFPLVLSLPNFPICRVILLAALHP